MLVKHLNPQNTANLSQCLEMVDVDDERPDGIIKNGAQPFHVGCQLVALNAKELIEQAMFILANVDKECARRSQKRAMIAFMFTAQVFDRVVDTGAHDERALRQVELMQLRQKIFIFRVLLITILD